VTVFSASWDEEVRQRNFLFISPDFADRINTDLGFTIFSWAIGLVMAGDAAGGATMFDIALTGGSEMLNRFQAAANFAGI
jgi:hypothetical protein